MSLIEKSDLKHDYSWTSKPGENPKFEGTPDSNLFDREDGHEVLYVINEYAKRNDITDKEKGLEMESHIHNNLGKEITTQRDVTDWLDSIFGSDR